MVKRLLPVRNSGNGLMMTPTNGKNSVNGIAVSLSKNKEQVALLKGYVKKGTVTLVYGAKDELHNDAVVLRELLGA